MRVLLDTHTLLWAVEDPSKLSTAALSAVRDSANDRLLSAATISELAIGVGQRKVALTMPYRRRMETAIIDLRFGILPITVAYAERQSGLPAHQKDPLDRLIIARRLVEATAIGSADAVSDPYRVVRLWWGKWANRYEVRCHAPPRPTPRPAAAPSARPTAPCGTLGP